MNLPTAPPDIGNKAVEGGMIMPLSFNLPLDLMLVLDPEVDVPRNAANDGRHANFQSLVNLSHALSSSMTAYVEVGGNMTATSPARRGRRHSTWPCRGLPCRGLPGRSCRICSSIPAPTSA